MLQNSYIHWDIFLYLFLELFVQNFGSGQHNYLCKVLIIYRIMGKAGYKHVISEMQGDGMITYIQHSKMCV